MEDYTTCVIILKSGLILVSKIHPRETDEFEIGEPDMVLIDPVSFDESVEIEKSMKRFPGKHLTNVTKMEIHSDNALVMVKPTNKVVSEYLVTISD